MKVMNATGRRRVLVVAFDFPPSLEIGAHACRQLTRHLPDSGWEPVVLTVQDRFSVNPEAEGRYDFPGIIVRTPALPHPLTLWAALRRYVDRTAADRSTVPYTDEAPRKGAAATLKRWVLSLLWVPDVQTGWWPVAVIAGLGAAPSYRPRLVVGTSLDESSRRSRRRDTYAETLDRSLSRSVARDSPVETCFRTVLGDGGCPRGCGHQTSYHCGVRD